MVNPSLPTASFDSLSTPSHFQHPENSLPTPKSNSLPAQNTGFGVGSETISILAIGTQPFRVVNDAATHTDRTQRQT